MSDIKFGTDGWRAIIAADFTFDNVAKVAQATGQWLLKTYGNRPKVVIGHDCRFHGRRFQQHVAQVLASMGCEVLVGSGFTSTPAVSLAVLKNSYNLGVVITASHNPPEYSGYKLKADFGGPATPAQIEAVEAELDQLSALTLRPITELTAEGLVNESDLQSAYLDHVRNVLDIAAIQGSGLKIVYDAMYGAGRGTVSALLGGGVTELRHDDNPGFMGQAPEPIEKNLAGLSATILKEAANLGLATDGDADRIGLYDEQGQFVDSHKILCLLAKYLYEERGLRGDIVKTFSTTTMLDKIGAAYGLKVHTTKIGFKYIGEMIVSGDVLVGGEESGGMAVKGHIPERDGVFIGLLVAEMMVKRNKKLSELVAELFAQFGPHYHSRNDLHTHKKDAALAYLASGAVTSVNGKPVTAIADLDGVKVFTEDGWLMYRGSGTEPVLRVYSEAASPELADAIVASGVAIVEAL